MKAHSLEFVAVLIALTSPLAVSAQDTSAAGEPAGDKGRAVVLAIGDPGSEKTTRALSQAAGQVVQERGLELVDPDRVDALVEIMAKPPEESEALGRVGELLDADTVVMVSAAKSDGGDLDLLVRMVPAGGKAGMERTRIASRASAPAQVRAMVRELLAARGQMDQGTAIMEPKAAVIGAMPVVPGEDPEPVEPVAAIPVVPVAPVNPADPIAPVQPRQPTLIYVGDEASAPGAMLPEGHVAPPRPSDEELNTLPPGRYLGGAPSEAGKVVGVFGVTAGVQAGLWFFSLLTWLAIIEEQSADEPYYEDSDEGENYHENYQVAANTAYVYLAISPALSSLVGWAMGNRSRNYDCTYGAVVGGAYLGAVAGLGMTYLGFYVREPPTVMFGYVLGPILLPAAGAAIGYLVGRKVEEGIVKMGKATGGPAIALSDGVEWTLPQPVVSPSMDGSRRAYIGVSLGTLSF